MDKRKFCISRSFLYHLTDSDNIKSIRLCKKILSTKKIIESSQILTHQEKKELLRNRRPTHIKINHPLGEFSIRDQKPLLLGSLKKCLIGMNPGDYIEYLNSRVFFWPTLHRLNIHFLTYINENPIIIKCKTEDCLKINLNPLFSNINTGATRCVPYYRGAAPRGVDTFLSCENYNLTPGTVAEVTFLDECILPEIIWISKNPSGPWKKVIL